MHASFAALEAQLVRTYKARVIPAGRAEIVKALATTESRVPARALCLFKDAPAEALTDLATFGKTFAPLPAEIVPTLPNGDFATATSWQAFEGGIYVHGSFDNYDVSPEISCSLTMVACRVTEGVALAVWPAAYPGELAALFGRSSGDHFTGNAGEWMYKFG